jgi:DNA-binding MarR family transcriptional regulator
MEENNKEALLSEAIQRLVDKGIVDYSVDENGEFLIFLTPLGKSLGNVIFGPPGGSNEG